jgi:GT2 family glycosyltransferase
MKTQNISVVTGTLNRVEYLDDLIANTVDANENIELVLVDGGSTDGTIEKMRLAKAKNPRINFIEVGKRSPYPHYMNLGIKKASHELICQWNDDVLLCNNWTDVFEQIDEQHDAYLFNWKIGSKDLMQNQDWLKCDGMRDNGWIIINNAEYDYPEAAGEQYKEVVMNYGVYKKDVFRKYGLYNTEYNYYCADSEMAMRAYHNGAKFKTCFDIKVCVLPAEKRAIMIDDDVRRHSLHCLYYVNSEVSGMQLSDIFKGEYLG